MSSAKTSHMKMPQCIKPGPLTMHSFDPETSNLFPKMPDHVNETAWELWYFDGVSSDASSGVTVSFFRDARSYKDGFRTQVNVIFVDGSNWGDELYFSDSIITEGESGRLTGVWKSDRPDMAKHATFEVSPGASEATLTFDVPSRVQGTVTLTALGSAIGGSSTTLGTLGPAVNYLRPIAIASVEVDLTLFDVDKDAGTTKSRKLEITNGANATGGMDRFWTELSWPQIMTESYFLRGNAGPYKVHLMRIISTAATDKIHYVSGRLYRDNKLICLAEEAVETSENYVTIQKQFSGTGEGKVVMGSFRDQNTGYAIDFHGQDADGDKKHWHFNVSHDRSWWNMPTSAPGPNATGNSGFIERVVGGLGDEVYEGWAGAGQAELS